MTRAPEIVAQLAAALRQSVQDPNQPAHQVQVSTLREQLAETLAQAPSNGFAPAWRQTTEEIGVANLLGNALRDRIEETFERNEITPATAANELEEISARLSSVDATLTQLESAFDFFQIGAEELAPGEFEIGFLIPRDFVDNELEELGSEFVLLDQIIGPFQELATGTRAQLEVKSISSSWFQVFVMASPGVALVMLKVVDQLLDSYKKILEIREVSARLKESKVPEEAISGILDHANNRMTIDIESIAKNLIKEYGGNLRGPGRKNELHIDIKRSLTSLAHRIDEGFSIDVRAGEVPEDEAEAAELGDDTIAAARIVAERQGAIKFMNLTGRPVLALQESWDPPKPEPDEGDAESEASEPD